MTGQAMEKVFPFLRKRKQVISIVGAGGKTTLMYAMAQYYGRQGVSVVVTTTTHIKRPQTYPVAKNKEELRRLLLKARIVVAGADAQEQKLAQAEGMGIKDYMDAADIVLVEADGAKHFPCKVPSDTEPAGTGWMECGLHFVIAVTALSCFYRPGREVLWMTKLRFVKEEAARRSLAPGYWGAYLSGFLKGCRIKIC